MKKDNLIRDAIDESLSGVRFDAKDMRSVLRAARCREETPARGHSPRRGFRLEMAFAMAMLLILIVPIGWFALRAQSMRTTSVVTAPGTSALVPQATPDPHADLIADAPAYTEEEREAIRIARACFEAVCDTSIFTFEEYAVSTGFSEGDGGRREYTVNMNCIYGNGCAFTVVVSLPSGEVLSHSTPSLATVPTYLDPDAPEIAAWYEKNGAALLTWPQAAQAEFSRRYEGAALRAALPGELTAEEAAALAGSHAAAALGLEDASSLYAYPMLYSERASGDGMARYVVSVFDAPVDGELPDALAVVSFAADGSGVSVAFN